ncbi:MAG TPA: phosphoglycerate dehydrogenase [Candidatus Baltobacteraceae bacterium]
MNPRCVIAESFAAEGQDVLRARGIDVHSCVGVSRDELVAALAHAQALIVRSETRVDRALLSAGPGLRVVARAGVGVDAIDVDAATEAGIVVVNTPSANTIAATELTFAMMLAAVRHIPDATATLRAGRWERAQFVGNELCGKTLGIVGLGRIGAGVAVRARAFGMTVLACDPYIGSARAQAHDAELVDLDALFARADIVTLHVPLTEQTKALVNAARLARMRPHAILVNCARGGVVDERALLAALDAGTIAGAALDVVAHEPPAADSPGSRLHRHPRVIATPHLGGSTHEALRRIAVELATDVADVLTGRPPQGAVNAPAPSGADAQQVRRYVDIAYRLGVVLPQLVDGSLQRPVTLVACGDLAQSDPAPLRAALLSGLLQTTTERRVSIVNAESIAAEIGLVLDVVADEAREPYAASLAVASGPHRLIGTALHNGPRIVEIDGYDVDAILEGVLIVTRHRDVPGVVGRVGMILGDANVNISTMQVGRSARGGDALMTLGVDRPLDRETLDAIGAIAGMRRVVSIVV